MEKREFQELAERISKGIASEQDIARYNYYYEKLGESMEKTNDFTDDEVGVEIFERINNKIFGKPKQNRFNYFLKVAAVFVCIVGAGLAYFLNYKDTFSVNNKLANNKEIHDVDPGDNKAVLILSDGSSVELEDASDGNLASQGHTQIKKNSNGEVVYSSSSSLDEKTERSLYNTLVIPKGGHYRLVLPDGTKVWLNSSSSLKFPVEFTENRREVELQGEAYFEVAKAYLNNKVRKPFIVKSKTQEIEVLGTWFNVNAYADENKVNTTLLEGSVRITSAKTGESRIITPGEQMQLSPTGNMHVKQEVDTEEILAWKNNMFYFNNTELKVIMRQLSRWYDIDIDYSGMPENRRFNGVLSRDSKLSQVLKIMEASSNLKFKIYEEKVTIKNK